MRVGDGTPGPGRPKGSQNKATKIAKQVIADAFESLGGVDALVNWAGANDDNLRVFYGSIYTKLIPVQNELTGKDGGPIQTEQVENDAAAFRRRLLSSAIVSGSDDAPGVTQH